MSLAGAVRSIYVDVGLVERILSKLNVGKKIVGTDIAPGAIAGAIKKAQEENLDNIEYYVADLQKEMLPENTYNLIWANGALHHIQDLDSVIPMLYASLKHGGYLISNEYVGPNYMQITPRHEELVNAVKHLLPLELRENSLQCYQNAKTMKTKGYYLVKHLLSQKERLLGSGTIWKKPSVSFFLKNDPSECINSEMIIPTLKNVFDDVDVRYFNGSILFFALGSAFYNNFDLNNPRHQHLLNLLFETEDTLVKNGEIPNIHAHIICKKR